MKKVLLFIFVLGFSHAYAGKKEKHLLHLVETEINSILKVKSKKDRLSYRLFELYAERMKLHRKMEEELVVKGKVKKSQAYGTSLKYYKVTQDYGRVFIKGFPKSRYVPEVYFTMATNIIEIRNNLKADEKEIVSLLQNAIQSSPKFELKHKARTTLAELYYTLNKFDEAIAYYNIVVKNKKDSWYTKNMLNLAWCHFQKKDYRKAIALGLTAHRYSRKSKFYSDVKDQVGNAMNYFYTFNEEPEKAIDFHIRYSKNDIQDKIIKLLNLSLNHISSTVALRAEVKARNYCDKVKNFECLYLMSQFKLNIFKDGKDYEGHYLAVLELTKEFQMLSKKQKKDLEDTTNQAINNIAELSSYIQHLAYKDHYIINGGKDVTFKRLIDNYNQLKIINAPFRYEYSFLQGEISYKELRYKYASRFYLESHKFTPKDKIEEFYPKLFKSMISLANEKEFNDKTYFEKTYLHYIAFKPKDPDTAKIYDNLFKFYINDKMIDKAIKLVETYHKNIPAKITDQREMFKVVLNHYIKRKNANTLAKWVKRMREGYLGLSEQFISQNITILAGLLFEKAKKLEKVGRVKESVKEYIKIFKNDLYPQKIKNDSAFNISIIYLKKNNVTHSYKWLQESLSNHIPENLIPKIDIVLSSAQQYYLLQAPEKSHDLYKFVTEKYCTQSKDYPKHYVQIQELNLALKKYQSYAVTLQNAQKCKVDKTKISLSKGSYVNLLVENNRFDELMKYVKNNPSFKEHNPVVFDDLMNKFWQNDFKHGELQKSENYVRLKEFANQNKMLSSKSFTDLGKLDRFVSFYQKSILTSVSIPPIKPFNLNVFNNQFNAILQRLTALKSEGMQLADSSNDPNIYSSTLAVIYFKFASFQGQVTEFKIESKDKDLVREIRKNFNMVVKGLDGQLAQIKQAYNTADKNDVVKNQFAKYFNFSDEMKKVALYGNKKIDVLNITEGK